MSLFKSDQSSTKKAGIFKRMKKEVSKSLFFFTAGALTSAITIMNRRRQKRLKRKYQEQIKELKAKKS